MPSDRHSPPLYPLRFDPVLKAYVWGGRAFESILGRQLPPGKVAESWEISDHPHGATAIAGGARDGASLGALLSDYGSQLVGRRNAAAVARRRFPLLIKLLDANDWLSVQVHPGDEYARVRENDLGKSEMWLVLHAAPEAEIILGFQRETQPHELEEALEGGRVDSLLHRVPARRGDVFFVPAGTVHAIGPGLLLAEIQQASDVTYRLFDWNRKDDAGRARELNVAQALEVIDFTTIRPGPVKPVRLGTGAPEHELLAECAYFRTERVRIGQDSSFRGACDGSTFEIWALLEGSAAFESSGGAAALEAVSWLLLPAALGDFAVRSVDGAAELLRVLTPELS